NPFFLEELSHLVTPGADASLARTIPRTLRGLLMVRVDRLAEADKRTLQLASVLGREFPVRLLAAAEADDPAGLEARLRELARLELLFSRQRAGEAICVFKHALTCDVVYESLLDARRRADHAGVGQALERVYEGRTEEIVELLAHHFGQSDDAERAVVYSVR